jgi:hypothetical protein
MFARMTLSLPLLMLVPGLASAQAYYSMGTLQSESELFGKVADWSAERNERVMRDVATVGRALDAYGDALSASKVVAGTTPEALSQRHSELAARFDMDWQQVNVFVGAVIGDTDAAFMAALERHLTALEEKLGVRPVACEPPSGVLGAAMGSNDCDGTDFTAQLVAAFDGDEELRAAVDEITGRTWPELGLERQPVAAVSLDKGAELQGDQDWVSPYDVIHNAEVFKPLYDAIEEEYRMAASELHNAQALHESERYSFQQQRQGLSDADRAAREAELQADLDGLKAASEALTTWRAGANADAMAMVWESVRTHDKKIRKEFAMDGLAVCLQATDLGGCSGTDRGYEVKKYLDKQKKIAKDVEKAAADLDGPKLGL